MALFDPPRIGASGAGTTGYTIDRSVRIDSDSGSYLRIDPSSGGNTKKWTFSAWVKFTEPEPDLHAILGWYLTGNNREAFSINGNSGTLQYQMRRGGGNSGYKAIVETDAALRDYSGWNHLVLNIDSDNSTAESRNLIWHNGVKINPSSPYRNMVSGTETHINGSTYYIGYEGNYGSNNFYIAEVNFIDGQSYDPTYFGETNSETGAWIPKAYTGSYSGNSYYLKFDDNSSASALGTDSSGLGNDVTPVNLSVSAGTGNDSLEDSPTNNFCTINKLDSWRSSTEVEDGALKFRRHASNFGPARGTFAVKSGKWYFEFTKGSGLVQAGFVNTDHNINYNGGDVGLNSSGSNPCGIAYDSRGVWYGYTGSNPSSISNDDIIGVAFDADNFKFYFHKNGTYYGSGNPSTSSNGIAPNASNTVTKTDDMLFAPYFNGENGNGYANFGQRPFSYSIPTGYKKLSTANLPDPAVTLPRNHFGTILYTGTGSSNSVSDSDAVKFTPDFVWIKKRNGSENHELQDAVRGATKRLACNTTSAESTVSGSISSFNSNGFTVVDAGTTNENGNTYVAWNWNGGGSTVTNNDGNRTSSIRANPTAGISIVTYTGNGSSGATVGHGLGAVPQCIIIKTRTSGDHWGIYHVATGNNKLVYMNIINAPASSSGYWNNTTPTSSVFTLGNDNKVNKNGDNYVAYVFSEVPGFSKFGSYTGNGNADGTFVNLGFKPAFYLFRQVTYSDNWYMYDNKRDTFNPTDQELNPSNSQSEASSHDIDFLSNGIKLRTNNSSWNYNNYEYIYLSFAENPFKFATGR